MTTLTDLKTAIAALLNTLPDPGQVVDHPGSLLDSEDDGDATRFYTVVLRNGTSEEPRTMGRCGKSSRVYRIDIHLHLPWDETDGENLESLFDERMEAVSDLFRPADALSGICDMVRPLEWQDDEDGFRQLRGNAVARYRKGVLSCTVSKGRGV